MKKLVLYFSILATVVACKPTQETKQVFEMPAVEDIAMYQVNPRVFAPENSLNAVAARIDSIRDLGVNVMWFMPIYPIGIEKARSEACFPMYHVGSQPAIGRSVMPVLVLIHSSLVSTKRVKSSFVNICSGTYLPIPKMLIPINNSLAIKKYANMVVKTKKLCYSNNVGRLSDDLFRQTGIIPHI